MTGRPFGRAAIALLCAGFAVLASSCSDLVAPKRGLQIGAANRDLDVATGSLTLQLQYAGQPILDAKADNCSFFLWQSNQLLGSIGCQSNFTLPTVPPGDFAAQLRLTFSAATSAPVSATIAGGQATTQVLDVASSFGLVDGSLRVNGDLPSANTYQICIDVPTGFGATDVNCAPVAATGDFRMFAAPGALTGRVRNRVGVDILSFSGSVEAGNTTAVGELDAAVGSIKATPVFGSTALNSLGLGNCGFFVWEGTSFRTFTECDAFALNGLPTGPASYQMRLSFSSTLNADISAVVTGGDTSRANVDFAKAFAIASGQVTVDGQPTTQFLQVCVELPTQFGGFDSSCGNTNSGAFKLLVPAGSGQGYVQTSQGLRLTTFTYANLAPGSSTTLPDIDAQTGSLSLRLVYGSQTFADAGQNCSTFFIFRNSTTGTQLISASCQPSIELASLPVGSFDAQLKETFSSSVSIPIHFDVAGGQHVDATVNVANTLGVVAGLLHINGGAPPSGIQVCINNPTSFGSTEASCGRPDAAGDFKLYAAAGPGSGFVQSENNQKLATFTFNVAAGQTTVIGALSTDAPGSTPAGTNITLLPENTGGNNSGTSNGSIELTFGDVTGQGTTTVSTSPTGPALPSGADAGSPASFYDMHTTATFTGPVTVCINYTGTTFPAGGKLKLYSGHVDGTKPVAWTDITKSDDPSSRVICGDAASLELFVVAAGPAAPPALPPSVAYTVQGTQGLGGWYTSDVTVNWQVDDHGTALTSSVECDSRVITTDTPGTSITCKATSPGGSDSKTVSVMRDATAPVVAFSGNVETYTVDQTVAITCAATDAMSGVAAATCPSADGDAYTFALGAHQLVGSATDKAGNAGSASVSFTVQVTYGSLEALVRRLVSNGGVAAGLVAKLDAAQAAAARGNANARAGQLGAFVNQVNAQAGKAVSGGDAQVLIALAGALGG